MSFRAGYILALILDIPRHRQYLTTCCTSFLAVAVDLLIAFVVLFDLCTT